jgi:acetyl esterase
MRNYLVALALVIPTVAWAAPTPNAQEQRVLDVLKALKPRPIEQLSAQEAREQPAQPQAVQQLLGKSLHKQPVGSVEDRTILGRLPIRIYKPVGAGPYPVLVYFHGGGWVLGSVNGFDSSCRALCNAADCAVISVGYRLGPEHRFPAAHEDCYAATQYVFAHAAELGVDPRRIAVGGESAGGNLAGAVCVMARNRRAPMPIYQLLAYPIAGSDFDTPSYREFAYAPILSRAGMKWFFREYLRTPADARSQEISLVRGSAAGLPPATFIAAEIDPLRSEGHAYYARLRRAGVPASYHLYKGVCHGFLELSAVVDQARAAMRDAGADLKKAFSNHE